MKPGEPFILLVILVCAGILLFGITIAIVANA